MERGIIINLDRDGEGGFFSKCSDLSFNCLTLGVNYYHVLSKRELTSLEGWLMKSKYISFFVLMANSLGKFSRPYAKFSRQSWVMQIHISIVALYLP